MRHIRKSGHRRDRRFRDDSTRPRTASDGETFCGAASTEDDASREGALLMIDRGGLGRERLCAWCVGEFTSTVWFHNRKQKGAA